MENVIVGVAASLFFLSVAGGAVMLVRLSSGPKGPIDFEGAYLHLISFITLFVSLFSLLSLTEPLLRLALAPVKERGMWQGVMNTVALPLVAFPAWVLSWRRVRRIALQKDDLLHRLYLYGVTTIAFISALVVVALLLSGLLRLLLDVMWWPGVLRLQTREVMKDLISRVVNALVASGVWLYHWRLAQRLPSAERVKPETG